MAEAPEVQITFAPGGQKPDAGAVAQLRRTMTDCVGVVRNGPDLRLALARIAALETAHGNSPSFLNMCATATLIAAGALMREESRGAHERLDFPDTDPGPGQRSFLHLGEALDLRAQCAAEIDPTEIDLTATDPTKENA